MECWQVGCKPHCSFLSWKNHAPFLNIPETCKCLRSIYAYSLEWCNEVLRNLVWDFLPFLGRILRIAHLFSNQGFPGGLDGKESVWNVGDQDSILGWGNILWIREWLPTPVFLLEEFQGKRSLLGYSPWGHKESDTTEWLPFYFFNPTVSCRLLLGPIFCLCF